MSPREFVHKFCRERNIDVAELRGPSRHNWLVRIRREISRRMRARGFGFAWRRRDAKLKPDARVLGIAPGTNRRIGEEMQSGARCKCGLMMPCNSCPSIYELATSGPWGWR